MAKSIVYYNEGRREFLQMLSDKKILGFETSIENKAQAVFFAALGIDNPTELTKRDNSGWIRSSYIQGYSKDKAEVSLFMLGNAATDDDLEEAVQFDNYAEYFEKCAEGGFNELSQKLEDSDWDNEMLERRMLKELDLLYNLNVKSII